MSNQVISSILDKSVSIGEVGFYLTAETALRKAIENYRPSAAKCNERHLRLPT